VSYIRLSSIALVSCFGFVVLAFALRVFAACGVHFSASSFSTHALFFVFFIFAGVVFYFAGIHLLAKLQSFMEKTTGLADASLRGLALALSPRALFGLIVVLSALSLFLELALIRWQASLFPVFALYKNFTLLACFCGLGLGYALPRRIPLFFPLALPLFAALLLVLTVLRYSGGEAVNSLFFIVPVREEISVFVPSLASVGFYGRLLYDLPVFLLLTVTFVLNALVFLPIAQLCGHYMQRVPPLAGYGCNLAGSFIGVFLLFALSWFWAGPAIWFGLSAALLFCFLLPLPAGKYLGLFSLLLSFLVLAWPVDPLIQSFYSPYQLIQKTVKRDGHMVILSAGSYFQKVYDFSSGAPSSDDKAQKTAYAYYELPFRTAPSLGRVAIVGAGSGNDVAAALRNGAGAIDAVEIDPVILSLGHDNHPEHPYDNPRVTAHLDDARNFFHTAEKTYDAIVYGVLDAHILLSHASNVRLDSFVYTSEGFKEAFSHLKPGGLMSVSFALPNSLMGKKIYALLKGLPEAGKPVAVLSGYDVKITTTFLVRKAHDVEIDKTFMKSSGLKDVSADYADAGHQALDLPTDDWPFFYMDAKMFPLSYVVGLILVLVLTVFLARALLPAWTWNPPLFPFLFLGSGFMLVETKAITELGLIFGNTWHVVGLAILGVLAMAFLANLLASFLSFKVLDFCYLCLLSVLGAGYALAVHGGLGAHLFIPGVAALLLLTCPLFFSGLAFSLLVQRVKDVPGALAYNLMGAMLGGVLEYNSMQFGFASLYLIALALYGFAWLTGRSKNFRFV
jgi:spermidine synthase